MARKAEAKFEITAEDKSAAKLRQAETQLKKVAGNIAGVAAVAAGAVAAWGAAVVKLGADLDKLAKTAKAAGVGVETFQAWEFAATQSGVSVEQFSAAMVRANTAVGQVAAGTGPAVAVFDRLGIAVRDSAGNIRSTESVVRDFAAEVSQLKTPAEQAAASAALFGRQAGPQMALLLREGEEGLKRFEDQARSLGLIVSEEATVAAEKFSDQMDVLKRTVTAQVADSIFRNAEAVEALAKAMTAVVTAAVGGVASVTRFAQFLGEELAARIGGIAANDVPRLTGALNDAREELARLESGPTAGRRDLPARIREARDEVERLQIALERAQEMVRNGMGPGQIGVAPKVEQPVAVELPAGRTDAQIKEAERLAKEEIRIREQVGRAMSVLREAVIQDNANREAAAFAESLARAAGFDSVAAQEAFARDQQLWLAKQEARAREFEEELAIELGYKDARDRAIQEAEQAHQDALLEIRTREFGTFQRLAMELAKFEQKTAQQKTLFVLGQAQMLTAGLAANSKAAFNINKAVSIAEAVINTATGVTAALRLGPKGIPLAALIAAQGAAQIATINSTQFGGAASGLTSSGPGTGIPSAATDLFTAPTVTSEERNRSTIRLELVADDSDIARSLIRGARVIIDDEDSVIVGRGSRQTLELAT